MSMELSLKKVGLCFSCLLDQWAEVMEDGNSFNSATILHFFLFSHIKTPTYPVGECAFVPYHLWTLVHCLSILINQ